MPLYGSRTHSRPELQRSLEDALGLEFEGHESLYWGEYELARTPSGELKVFDNVDNLADEDESPLMEPDFPEHRVLVQVDGEMPSVESIQGVELLDPER